MSTSRRWCRRCLDTIEGHEKAGIPILVDYPDRTIASPADLVHFCLGDACNLTFCGNRPSREWRRVPAPTR